MKRLIWYLVGLIILLMVPLLLQKKSEQIDLSADQLVIVSPHNESTRFEIEQAFRQFYLEKTGRKVSLDWRAIGGASEIVRYLNSAFTANFRDFWVNEQQQEWSEELSLALLNPATDPESAHWQARQAFLSSDIGIGIDLFFGGGQYDFNKQAKAGTLVPCGVRERHPEWFTGEKPILQERLGGETWYDRQDRYYGVCFSSFGICVNVHRLEQLGFDASQGNPLKSWQQLADPRLFNAIGLADPSKSGSINKCFEMLIQRQMQDAMRTFQEALTSGSIGKQQALDQAWAEAINLIKQIGGNASYLTFAASKVPVDAAQGQIAAGMCIDFYGRAQAEWANRLKGETVMLFQTPEAASAVSADPVGILRGAPHAELARLFVDFLLSEQGQRLWNYRAGTPGGPQKYTLHRLPVRRDVYTAADRILMSAPEADPFALADAFEYQGAWTGPLFDVMRTLIRVMVIDCEQELCSAWQAICSAGGPEKVASAMQVFNQLPFAHRDAAAVAQALRNSESQAIITREWGLFFRAHFLEATRLAKRARVEDKS
ncbi:MAG: ABC transporter substrate-binding protein [Lentisphaeria bacterium]